MASLKGSKCEANEFKNPKLFLSMLRPLYEGEDRAALHIANHLPWGTPLHGDIFSSITLLMDKDHVTGKSLLIA